MRQACGPDGGALFATWPTGPFATDAARTWLARCRLTDVWSMRDRGENSKRNFRGESTKVCSMQTSEAPHHVRPQVVRQYAVRENWGEDSQLWDCTSYCNSIAKTAVCSDVVTELIATKGLATNGKGGVVPQWRSRCSNLAPRVITHPKTTPRHLHICIHFD